MDEVIERKWGVGFSQNVEKNTSILNSNKNHELDLQFQIGIEIEIPSTIANLLLLMSM